MPMPEPGEHVGRAPRRSMLKCEDCGAVFDPADVKPGEDGELSCPKCSEDTGDDESDEKEVVGSKVVVEPEIELDPDTKGAVDELEPIMGAISKLEQALETQKLGGGSKKSFLSRIFGADADPLALVREVAKTARAEVDAAKKAAAGRRKRVDEQRKEIENLEKKLAAKFEIAKVDAGASASTALAIANDRLQVAREAIETVGEARKQRDTAMSSFNVFRSQILGLARSLGAKIVTADEKEALAWLMANARGPASKENRELRDAALADKLARTGMIAELEQAAERSPTARAAMLALAAEWQAVYLDAPAPAANDAKVEAARARVAAIDAAPPAPVSAPSASATTGAKLD